MIQRYTAEMPDPDDEGGFVLYEDAKAALLGVMAIPRYGDALIEVRSILGDEAVDEWIARGKTQ